MKKILMISLCLMLLTGCGATNNKELDSLREEVNSLKQQLEANGNEPTPNENTESTNLDDLKKLIDDNNKKIDDLSKEKKSLEDKVKKIQDTNDSLSKKVSDLESANKSLKSTIDSLSPSNSSSKSNQYTITKKQLIGTWEYSNGHGITFTDSNCDVIDNWIIYHQNSYDSTVYYMYKNGKLYVTDDGQLYTKK